MNSFRAAWASAWRHGCLVSAGFLAFLALPLQAAPRGKLSRSAAGTGAKPSPAASVFAANAAPRLEFADAYPSTHPAPPDLQLPKESANKAEALVYFSQALIAEDQADHETALAKYRRALELDPSYSELAVKVAFELAKRNDASGGIQILKDAVKAAPKEPLPLIYLSQLYSKHLKKPDLALKYAEQAVALDPNQIAAHMCVLEVLLTTNQQKRAEQALERALTSKTDDAMYWLQLGEVYERMHVTEDDTPIPDNTLQKMNDVFRKAAELGKKDAVIQAKVGNYFVDTKQLKEGVSYYLAAVSLKQKSEDPVLLNVREKLAHVLLQLGEQDEAIKLLENITKEDPLRFATFELLGELYEQKGDVDRALANYQHSLLLDASEPTNHLRIAELQLRMKRADEAVETAKIARAKFPDNPQAIYMLPIVLSQAKKHTDAMTAFAAAHAEFQAEHEEYLNAAFYFAYGAAAEQAGLPEKAAEMLQKCIELEPNNAAQAYNYLGYMWVDRNENLDEAGEYIRKALQEDPDNGAYIDSIGWYYFRKGELDKALKELLRAAEIVKPEDPVVYDHIGDVYSAMGNDAEAIRYWQKSLELDKEQTKVSEKLDAAKQKASSPPPQPQASGASPAAPPQPKVEVPVE